MNAKILESIEDEHDNYEWHLNGQHFTPMDSTVRLKINFPEIDREYKFNSDYVNFPSFVSPNKLMCSNLREKV